MIVLVGTLAALGRGWPAALAAAMCARLLFDPATFDYYSAPVILALAVYELAMGYRNIRTGVGVVFLWLVPHAVPWRDGPLCRATILTTLIVVTTAVSPSLSAIKHRASKSFDIFRQPA